MPACGKRRTDWQNEGSLDESRHRRVAGQGQDDQQIPRQGLRVWPPMATSATCPRRKARSIRTAISPCYGMSIDKNGQTLTAIAKAAKGASRLILATDPDREGEAITWHIARDPEAKRPAQGQDGAAGGVHRDHPARGPRGDATSRARSPPPGRCAAGAPRARLPGRLQPFAGAVAQGAARALRRPRAVAGAAHDLRARGGDRSVRRARILDDRSRVRDIRQAAVHRQARRSSTARSSSSYRHRRRSAEARERIDAALEAAAFAVTDVDSKERKRSPSPPFTTSTLQQEASRKLGFAPSARCSVAQKLYEGVDRRRRHGRPDHLHAYRRRRSRAARRCAKCAT